jgi:pilus assembly protein CpaB
LRPSGLIVLVLALVLGGAAAFMAREFLLSRTLQPPPAPEFKTLVVARQALPFGTALNDENTVEITWPMATTLEDGFATKAQLFKEGRRVVLVPLQRNEPILASKITGPNQRATLSTMIEEGMRAVSVRVDDVRGVAGFVQPGDRVDVILTRGEGTVGDSAFADVLLQNVRVLGIDQLVGDKQDRPTVARAVTLELNVQQSQKVILAQGIGRLSLVLRQAGGADPEPARRVTAADLGLAEYVEKKEAPKPEPAPPPAVKVDPNTIVNVFRGGGKREQYSVITEDPRRATR